jgi:hypothetical protein
MAITSKENTLGAWAFLAGVILAIIIGLSTTQLLSLEHVMNYSSAIYGVLVLLGLIVGFSIRIPDNKDAQNFLLIGAVLVVVSKFGMDSVRGSLIGVGIGDMVSGVFGALLALFVPATIIVALKALFGMAKV